MVSIVICFDTLLWIRLVNWLKGTEREGFEPSVNKSLHSSSNATPSTTRPSLLHNDYGPETEWIVSHSYYIFVIFLNRYVPSILTVKKYRKSNYKNIENFSSKKNPSGDKDHFFFIHYVMFLMDTFLLDHD